MRTYTDLPPPKDGADPWCTWCDDDLPDRVWLLPEHDNGRWPPAFCSEECAESWGCAEDEGEAYQVAASDIVAGREGSQAGDADE